MAQELQAKELKAATKQMQGFSERQIDEHYSILYKGYVTKVNEIRADLEKVDRAKANQSYSALRAAKSEESFCLNGVKLHEAYFDNLGGKGGKATGKALQMIERDFGSYEAWETDFKASGIAARGWVVLAYDADDGKLHNYSCDVHNVGGIWNAMPILVLDTYEHAYCIDFGVKRAPYIDAFMGSIDWEVVNARLKKVAG